MPTGPKKQWRTLEAHGKATYFLTEDAARAHGQLTADRTGSWVGLEHWNNDHTVKDGINNGWSLVETLVP